MDILLANDSTTHALGKLYNIMFELQMNFVHVDFVIVDMEIKTSSPIILGKPF
jgi:hypothetical protein